MKLKIEQFLKVKLEEYQVNRSTKKCRKLMKNNILKYGRKFTNLSKKEKKEINTRWKKYGYNPDMNAYKWFYNVGNIKDWRYITEDFYVEKLMSKIYNVKKAKALDDKNLYDLYFNDISMPRTIGRRIRGLYLDREYRLISYSDLVKIIKNRGGYVVIKPSTNTLQGNDVRLIKAEQIEKILKLYEGDFIIQERIIQHPTFASLNESSTNVVRITSMIVNNKVLMLSPTIRVGDSGSFTDQGGKKQFCIGIDENGRLKEFGLVTKNSVNKETVMPNGFKFGGIIVPGFENMKIIIEKVHPRLSCCPIIGWDFVTDFEGKAVLIECNLHWSGILKYQECNGPLFGDKTEEILDSVFSCNYKR